ncbi:MAG: Sir2 silent information regulator family NAD-dependent deacetylase [Treponema sp.]|nr:Sir2 silent information regulator family NAD-dependent deacetylase [Treponema sp.]
MNASTETYSAECARLVQALRTVDAVAIGAGAGLSAAAGFLYSGARFQTYFSDFARAYGIRDMYSGGFYPFETREEYWAWWSRHIYYNRFVSPPQPVYETLLQLVRHKDYFVLTTNVDHLFQKAGFDRARLFYTQGDYGLWQCSVPCHQKTYDNETAVRTMLAEQHNMRIPSALIPQCPVCGKPMSMNLRSDATFVQDAGWYAAQQRYDAWIHRHAHGTVLYLELGVGSNTPGIIKYSFWEFTRHNSDALYACVNYDMAVCPEEIAPQAILIRADIAAVLDELTAAVRVAAE